VLSTFQAMGFVVVREAEHIGLQRQNTDGTRTIISLPNHRRIKGATLRHICTVAAIDRDVFLAAFART
jgi:hypothetical protein